MAITDSYSESSYLKGFTCNMHSFFRRFGYDCVLLELILADQVADQSPIEASSGQEWQFYIYTVRAHIGRSTGRSTLPVEASIGQKLQFDISTVTVHIGRSTGRYTPC